MNGSESKVLHPADKGWKHVPCVTATGIEAGSDDPIGSGGRHAAS